MRHFKVEFAIIKIPNENKILVLQLDHINGDYRDNRLENLRLLCPNCHSQTETFGSKNLVEYNPENKQFIIPRLPNKCLECQKEIGNDCQVCGECYRLYRKKYQKINHQYKIEWPEDDKLLELLKQSNFVQLGISLGVSGNAIRKRLACKGLI